MQKQSSYRWKFFRAGGFDQASIESGADLANLDTLDQKLWVALACPIQGLEFDSKTLELIDTDNDGRIRAPELIAAAKWLTSLLKNPDDALKGSASLPLAAINDAAEGQQLIASARQLLANLQKTGAAEITLEDVADRARIFAQTSFNGDGVITQESAGDEQVKSVIADIISALGAETDLSGKPGINQAKADQFFAEAQAHSDWWKRAEGNAAILPLGDATPAAVAAVQAVRTKVDDYFARCQLAAFDDRALSALNREEKDFLALAAKDLTISSSEIAAFPLTKIEPGKALPLKGRVNPAWADALATLHSAAVKPLLGDKTAITESEWHTLNSKLAPCESWLASKAGALVEKLGAGRLREILAGNAKEAIANLIARDKALEPEANAIASVERLIRYYRDLYPLCTNFVNFKDFYDRGEPAIFQAGTLYLDQRSCDFTLPVGEPARHALLAGLAGAYLAYCDCVRKGTGEKRQIVAAFTNGESENLMVGRNGLFYDRKGRDWDATITKIIENPISVRQAFWSPYRKLVRFIEEQVAKRAAAAESSSTARLQTAATHVAEADKVKVPETKKVDVGTVAALSVAVGAIGTAIGYFLSAFTSVKSWQIPLIVLALMLLISMPSVVIAYLKLRRRNIGPILDANGWAVNARAKISVPFGASLTGTAKLPPGAVMRGADRFAPQTPVWPKVLLVLFLVWWIYAYINEEGWLHRWTHGSYGKDPNAAQADPAGGTNTNTPPAAATPAALQAPQ